MPGIKHEQAVRIIGEMLAEEFKGENIILVPSVHLSYGCTPDLVAYFSDKTMIVVEVGTTKPSKIHKYLSDDKVREIRWYDKAPHPVAVWDKRQPIVNHVLHLPEKETDTVKNYFSIKDRYKKAREELRSLRLAKKQMNDMFNADAFALCPFCLKRFRLSDGKTHHWNKDNVIISCGKCSPSSANDLNMLEKIAQKYQKAIDEKKAKIMNRSQKLLESVLWKA